MKKIFILLLMAIFISNVVSAIRISPDSIRIEFVPNFEKSYDFNTERAENVGIAIEGDLAKYVSVEKNDIAKDGTFVIKVKLPAEIETPGKNLIFIGITEGGKGGGMVSGTASIRTPIDIRVPYPGIYAEIAFNVHDLNINETANFAVTVNNLGKKDIGSAKAVIDVIDNDRRLVEKLVTEEKEVIVNAKETLEVFFNASKHTAGTYNAFAHVTYADRLQDLESIFKIGTLNIEITNYTKVFFKDKIAKFDIEIESGWNSKIGNVFAEVEVFNNTREISSFKTVSISLGPWEKKKISTLWDNEGLGEGAYDVEINLLYEGKTTKVAGKIEIIEPKEEIWFKKYFNITNLLITAVVLLLIITNIIVLFKKRKK